MITIANYAQQINPAILNSKVLKDGHSFISSFANLYGKDKTITEAIDNHIKLVNIKTLENNESNNNGSGNRSVRSSTKKSGSKSSTGVSNPKSSGKPNNNRSTRASSRKAAKPKSRSSAKGHLSSAKPKATAKTKKPIIQRTVKTPELSHVTRFLNLPKQPRTLASMEGFLRQVSNAIGNNKYADHLPLMKKIKSNLEKGVKMMKDQDLKFLDIALGSELIKMCESMKAGAKERLRVSYLGEISDNSTTIDIIKNIYSNLFPGETVNVNETVPWDNLEFTELIIAVEKEFNLSISDDQAEKINTIKKLADFVDKNLGKD